MMMMIGFSDLFPDLQILILELCSRVQRVSDILKLRLVCRRWRDLLSRAVRLAEMPHLPNGALRVLKLLTNVEKISIYLNPNELAPFSALSLPSLRHLQLQVPRCTIAPISFTKLQSLQLFACSFSSIDSSIDSGNASLLISGLPQLTSLQLYGEWKLNPIATNTNLIQLEIAGGEVEPHNYRLSLASLAGHFPNLERLLLKLCNAECPSSLALLSRLTRLELSDLYGFADEGERFAAAVSSLTQLQTLILPLWFSRPTAAAPRPMPYKASMILRAIEWQKLSHLRAVECQGFVCMQDLEVVMRNVPQMEDFAWMEVEDLNMSTMFNLLTLHCPQLSNIGDYSNRALVFASEDDFLTLTRLSKLEVLRVSNASITSLAPLAYCTNLLMIAVDSVKRIDPKSIIALASLHRLAVVDLCYEGAIQDQAELSSLVPPTITVTTKNPPS